MPAPAAPQPDDYSPTALPSTAARVLAFASIILGGLAGALIGWALVDLQCDGDCTLLTGFAILGGALAGATGVAVVATLALRAMGEWRMAGDRDRDRSAAVRRGRP
ncbi:MAG: hypothetical protein ACLFXM_04485 [Acidimicrobiia bacterium]